MIIVFGRNTKRTHFSRIMLYVCLNIHNFMVYIRITNKFITYIINFFLNITSCSKYSVLYVATINVEHSFQHIKN